MLPVRSSTLCLFDYVHSPPPACLSTCSAAVWTPPRSSAECISAPAIHR